MNAHGYLESIMPTREEIDAFIDPRRAANNGWTFDAELGWVHCDAVHENGVDQSRTYYHYEPDGARRVVNCAGAPCRVHTYGDSFTHCDQVSDGETWQEYLAAHLQEPIRNYGVGGYSVYQAYRRMLSVEKRQPAPFIILNIWADDHFRNLDAWRSIRSGRHTRCGFPLPHLQVDVPQDRCEQVENIIRRPEEVHRLCDTQFVCSTFEHDHVLGLMTKTAADPGTARKLVGQAQVVAGNIEQAKLPDPALAQRIAADHTEAALFATKKVVGWTEQFVQQNASKLFVILSYSRQLMADDLEGRPRFDQGFVDWLRQRPSPVFDMRDAFRRDYAGSKLEIDTYLDRFYNGHHTPQGNFFTAWSLKEELVKWLEPSPLPYRE